MKINEVPKLFSKMKFLERYYQVKAYLEYTEEQMCILVGINKSKILGARKRDVKFSKREIKLALYFMYFTEDLPEKTRREKIIQQINKVTVFTSVRDLSKKIGIHYQYIYEFKRGKYSIYSENTMKIINYFFTDLKGLDEA